MKSIYRLKGRGPTRERAVDSGARPEDQEKAELREKQVINRAQYCREMKGEGTEQSSLALGDRWEPLKLWLGGGIQIAGGMRRQWMGRKWWECI